MEFGFWFINQWMQGIFGRTWERPDDGWLGFGNIDVAMDRWGRINIVKNLT